LVFVINYRQRYANREELRDTPTATPSPQILTSPEVGVKAIWIAQDNQFITVRQQDWQLEISIWRAGIHDPERRYVDLKKLVGLIPNVKVSPSSSPPRYAIAPDLTKIAFINGRVIALKSLVDESDQSFRYQTLQNSDVTGLGFTEDSLAVLYLNGMLQTRDTNDLYVMKERPTGLTRTEAMWTDSRLITVVSFHDSEGRIFYTDYWSSSPKTFVFSITSINSFVFAQYSEIIAFAIGSSEVTAFSRNASLPGRVRALTFYDKGRVLAAGDFDGIFPVEEAPGTRSLWPAPRGIRLLAARENVLACADENNLYYTWRFLKAQPSPTVSATPGNAQNQSTWFWLLLGAWTVAIVTPAIFSFRWLKRRFAPSTTVEEALVRFRKQATSSSKTIPIPAPPKVMHPLPEPPADLVESCAKGECVLYAGAGLSAQAQFPTWNKFVHQVLNWATENGHIEPNVAESYRAEIDAGAADLVADSIISKFSEATRTRFDDYLRTVFLKPVDLPNTHGLLQRINFSSVLTTNFDNLLESAFARHSSGPAYTYDDAEALLSALTTRQFFILKLYGTLRQGDSVLVAPAQYKEAISANREFSEFMETLFFSRTLLFIGASLEGIQAYINSISLPGGSNRKHYALVAVTNNLWSSRADALKRHYGIEVLPYTPTEGFPEVFKFVEKLQERVQSRARFIHNADNATSRLSKVVLQNIGPFDYMEFDLDANWNILLGDNGVGKSSVLKAISIAIMGEKAQPYAGRLIKSGSTSESFIILQTNRGTSYKTTLKAKKRGYDEAEVITPHAHLLEAEGWLALGFPPLRLTSWRPRGAVIGASGRSRPSPDDLLPLIKSEPDPRLDNLKDWLVNMDYLSVKEEGRAHFSQLALQLFDVINRLTHPLKLHFRGVSSEGRVMIETEHDGPVPIELISQGLSSLISWVGVLMQRLYEIYEADENPLERFAVVLMDELDAHMHPAWQQALVPRLKEVFKNTQFIATTHSPLIAMGLPPEQIIRLMRNEEGEIEQLEVEADMTVGRADQVLTGELFDVRTARDLYTQSIIDRYSELAASDYDQLSEAEQQELPKLVEQLKMRMPSPAERKEARTAYEFINTALKERIQALPEDQKQKVLAEVRVQLQEIVTGSWRPQ
jgi:predicted ATPase